MNITFKERKLRKLVNDDKNLVKEYGKIRASKIRLRLTDLMCSETLEDTKNLPGNYHELTENKKGVWACDLDQPYRLLFKPHEDPIPSNADGQYIWKDIKGVEIISIVNYHKER